MVLVFIVKLMIQAKGSTKCGRFIAAIRIKRMAKAILCGKKECLQSSAWKNTLLADKRKTKTKKVETLFSSDYSLIQNFKISFSVNCFKIFHMRLFSPKCCLSKNAI